MTRPLPSYIGLHRTGELEQRVKHAYDILSSCRLCPRECGVDRLKGEPGFCRSGLRPRVASAGTHFGEEPPLVGRSGSGTVFLSGCTMRCEFCQNYGISQCGYGEEVEVEALAAMMLDLQARGCHNINFVTPTHFAPQILGAVEIAAGQGLSVPLVYNTGGYDPVDTLRLLDGIFDIYMPDAKYGDDAIAKALSHAPGYAGVMKGALREMYRQVGDLSIIDGIAAKGLLIRHLVLPGGLAGSEEVLRFIAEEISRDSYVNIMDQYRPSWHVREPSDDPLILALRRPITRKEYEEACALARRFGLHRGFP